ncbi:hypothetical protein [Oceaniferula marina]|nr:hypothetical protein [Oceaniferula marina]
MKLTTITTTVALICGSAALLQAQESVPATPLVPAAQAEPSKESAKKQIEAITSAFDKEVKAFYAELRKVKDRDKRNELFKERPDSKASVGQILALVKQDPKAEGVEDGLAWSVRRARPQQSQEILELLLTHYKDSKVLGSLAQNYGRSWGEHGIKELRLIADKAGSEKVRQGAMYYLGSKLGRQEATKKEGLEVMKKLQQTPGLAESNPRLFEQVKGEIFVAENLSVGCKAPDIVGKDQDDKEFKLSDYKGQVVLLDFWGIW